MSRRPKRVRGQEPLFPKDPSLSPLQMSLAEYDQATRRHLKRLKIKVPDHARAPEIPPNRS